MGLFDKKECGICGGKIGLLGGTKLEDGNLCGDCHKKLSPYYRPGKSTSINDVRAHLEYREANKALVQEFNATKIMGKTTKVYVDEEKGQFLVSGSSNFKSTNPDVMNLTDVSGCDLDTKESRTELKRKDKDGNSISYNPKKYKYSYDLSLYIYVNNPYFDKITIDLIDGDVDIEANEGQTPNVASNAVYKEAERTGTEIKRTFASARNLKRMEEKKASEPKKAVTCPHCGATTIPDASGCCEYCGASIG